MSHSGIIVEVFQKCWLHCKDVVGYSGFFKIFPFPPKVRSIIFPSRCDFFFSWTEGRTELLQNGPKMALIPKNSDITVTRRQPHGEQTINSICMNQMTNFQMEFHDQTAASITKDRKTVWMLHVCSLHMNK